MAPVPSSGISRASGTSERGSLSLDIPRSSPISSRRSCGSTFRTRAHGTTRSPIGALRIPTPAATRGSRSSSRGACRSTRSTPRSGVCGPSVAGSFERNGSQIVPSKALSSRAPPSSARRCSPRTRSIACFHFSTIEPTSVLGTRRFSAYSSTPASDFLSLSPFSLSSINLTEKDDGPWIQVIGKDRKDRRIRLSPGARDESLASARVRPVAPALASLRLEWMAVG